MPEAREDILTFHFGPMDENLAAASIFDTCADDSSPIARVAREAAEQAAMLDDPISAPEHSHRLEVILPSVIGIQLEDEE